MSSTAAPRGGPPVDWRPMYLAPRDSFVLAYGKGGMYVMRIDKHGQPRSRFGRPVHGVTHWTDLPAPPAR